MLQIDTSNIFKGFKMSKLIKILEEDDCAPDAEEYFAKDFEKLTKLTLTEFKQLKAKKESKEYSVVWDNKEFRLEIHADSPFYVLYKYK